VACIGYDRSAVIASVTDAAAWDAYVPDQVVTRLRPSPSRPFPFTATRFNSPSGGRDQYFFSTSEHQNSIAHSSQNGTHRYGFKFAYSAAFDQPFRAHPIRIPGIRSGFGAKRRVRGWSDGGLGLGLGFQAFLAAHG
jgi:hypothetical protein